MDETKFSVLSVNLNPEVKQKLREKAKLLGYKDLSEFIRSVCIREVAGYGPINKNI